MWTHKGNIKGSKGDRGEIGLTGPAGEQGVAGSVGPTGAQGPAGPAGMEWKGTYSPDTDYIDGDAVYYNGGSWFAAGDPPVGEAPSMESLNWNPLAIQGLQGPIGETGPQGPTGAQGIQGIPGVKGDTGDTGQAGPSGKNISNAMYSASGPVAVAEGAHRYYVPVAGTIVLSVASLGTAGTDTTTLNVRKNGVTAHVLNIGSGVNYTTTSSPVAVAAGDYITVSVTTAGSGATDLSVLVRIEED